MAMKSYPFKAMNIGTELAPVWDRSMSSADDASRFDLFSNGVCGVNDLKVTAAGGNKIQVGLGKVRIDGREGVVHTEPEELPSAILRPCPPPSWWPLKKSHGRGAGYPLVLLENQGDTSWPPSPTPTRCARWPWP